MTLKAPASLSAEQRPGLLSLVSRVEGVELKRVAPELHRRSYKAFLSGRNVEIEGDRPTKTRTAGSSFAQELAAQQ